jgi:hypothetical protein
LTVLPETDSSGEHKFKLLGVGAEGVVNEW